VSGTGDHWEGELDRPLPEGRLVGVLVTVAAFVLWLWLRWS
jgi:hypothetical protein